MALIDSLGITIDSLIGKLHSMLANFASDIEDMIEENEAVTVDDIPHSEGEDTRAARQERGDNRQPEAPHDA